MRHARRRRRRSPDEARLKGAVTVVYGARDQQHSDAAVICDEIARRLRTRTARSA